jgi:hypothetical protein
LPDKTVDLPGHSVWTRSQPLATGHWYFNLRTVTRDERWTSTVHLGPFIIGPAAVTAPVTPNPTPPASPSPTPVVAGASATPVETPTPTPSPAPTAPPVTPSPVPTVPPTTTPVPPLVVQIDVRPGYPDNTINLSSREWVPVAVITSTTFDAALIEPGSVHFAGAAALRSRLHDVDADGDYDMLLHFEQRQLVLSEGDHRGCLNGRLASGQAFEGCDAIVVVTGGSDDTIGQ